MKLGSSFWRLFTASGATFLSDGVAQAALPLLAASLTRDTIAVSLLASLVFLPWLLFGMISGALVDRVDRRGAMAVASGARAALLAVLGLLVLTHTAGLAALYLVAFLVGTAETVYDNAARSMLPAVVETDRLETANSMLSTAEGAGSTLLGAPVGALLFVTSTSLPFWAVGAAYLTSALVVVTVPGRFRTRRPEPTTMRADLAEGLRWLLRHPLLRPLVAVAGVSVASQALSTGILVLFALQNLGLSSGGYGVLLAVAGVGGIIGSAGSPLVTSLLGRWNAVGVCKCLGAASLVGLGLTHRAWVGMVFLACSTASVSAVNVQIMSLRQALVPDEFSGRVQGAYRTVLWGGIPIGSVLGGVLGHAFGLPAVMMISGSIGALSGVAIWVLLLRHRDLITVAFRGSEAGLSPAGARAGSGRGRGVRRRLRRVRCVVAARRARPSSPR